MTITWYNNNKNTRNCDISVIADIECYEETDEKGKLFGVRIRKDKVLFGGELAEFRQAMTQSDILKAVKEMNASE